MILKAHLIIMDFLNLRMPGMLDDVITYVSLERNGEHYELASFDNCIEQYQNGENPSIGVANLDPKVTLPGLIVYQLI